MKEFLLYLILFNVCGNIFGKQSTNINSKLLLKNANAAFQKSENAKNKFHLKIDHQNSFANNSHSYNSNNFSFSNNAPHNLDHNNFKFSNSHSLGQSYVGQAQSNYPSLGPSQEEIYAQKLKYLEFINNFDWQDACRCSKINVNNWSDIWVNCLFADYEKYKYPLFRNLLESHPKFIEKLKELQPKLSDEKFVNQYSESSMFWTDSSYFNIRTYVNNALAQNEFLERDKNFITKFIPKITQEYENNLEQWRAKNQNFNAYRSNDLITEIQETAKSEKSEFLRQIYNNRLEAIRKFQTEQFKNAFQRAYEVSEVTREFFANNSLDPKIFESCSGDIVQHALHLENLTVAQEAASIWKSDKHQEIKDIMQVAGEQAYQACVLNKSGQTTTGMLFIDAAHCILAFGKGVKNAACDRIENIKALLINPIGTIKDLAVNVVCATGKAFAFYVSMQPDNGLYFTAHDESRMAENAKYIQDQVKHVRDWFTQSSNEEIIEKAGYYIADFVILPRCGSNKLQKLGEPGRQTAKVVGLAVKKGSKTVLDAIDTVKKYPHLIKNNQTISKAIEKSATYIENLEHYYQNLWQYAKDAKYQNSSKISPYFLPLIENGNFVVHTFSDKIYKYVDKLGNLWEITKDGIRQVTLSKMGQETFGWMNEHGLVNRMNGDQIKDIVNKKYTSHINELSDNGNLVKPLGRGSTGRTVPRDLHEQLAMKEVMSRPGGKDIGIAMTDPRWPASEGWVKVAQHVEIFHNEPKGIQIHFLKNTKTGPFDDFKFKDHK